MSHSPVKAPSHCPHCGFVQEEPEHLISTYCRGCGSYYQVPAFERENRAGEHPPSLFENAFRRIAPRPPRKVACHRCGQSHEVSGHARTTICPDCHCSIELRDLTFSSNASRPVDIRGRLTILPTGYLSNALIICGEAHIEGRISGTLFCETNLRLACTGRLICQMNALTITVDRDAKIEIAYPVKTGELVVHGHAIGDFECGRIRIAKGGTIEGRVSARALVVDRGASLFAEMAIRPAKAPETVANPEKAAVDMGAALPLAVPAY